MDLAVQSEPQRGFWASVREALRGSHQDYTAGSLNRSILLLAIPMVLEMVLESLFAVVDTFWVGRLGANAVATVGLTESILALVFSIGLGVSLSTTAMIARRIGEKDPEDAAISAVQAIVLGMLISLVLGIPAGIAAPHLLRLMGASPAIVSVGSGYARIALGGCGEIVMLFLATLGVVFFVYATPVVRLFVDDPAVIAIGARALRTFACGNIAYAWVMVMLQAFNGAGDTLTPTFVNFFGFWVLEIPLAWFLAMRTHLRAEGAFLSVVIAECSIAVASLILFRQGRWKRQRI
jgi:Na+-driven multidrug efflux pump